MLSNKNVQEEEDEGGREGESRQRHRGVVVRVIADAPLVLSSVSSTADDGTENQHYDDVTSKGEDNVPYFNGHNKQWMVFYNDACIG